MVRRGAGAGWIHDAIAHFLGISDETLRKHYGEELEEKKRIELELADKVLQKARNGDTACMFFWLKCRAGWKETQRQELDASSESIRPIQVIIEKSSSPTSNGLRT
jgi:hypothetical protein